MLSEKLLRTLDEMLSDNDSFSSSWQVSPEWTSKYNNRPLEFEEYLRSKWGNDLGSQVLLIPLDQINWWNYKPPEPKELNYTRYETLVRVPNVDWDPISKPLPVLEFLLCDNPVSFWDSLKKVNYL